MLVERSDDSVTPWPSRRVSNGSLDSPDPPGPGDAASSASGRTVTQGREIRHMAVLDHREGLGLAPSEGAATRPRSPRRAPARSRSCGRSPGGSASTSACASPSTASRPWSPAAVAYLVHVGGLTAAVVQRRRRSLLPIVWVLAVTLNRAYEPRSSGSGPRSSAGSRAPASRSPRWSPSPPTPPTSGVARHYVLISLPARHGPHRRRALRAAPVAAPSPRQGRVPAPGRRGRPRGARSWRCCAASATSASTACRSSRPACRCPASGPR